MLKIKLNHFVTFITLLFSAYCLAQQKNIVEPELPATELHKANIGKIFFTENRISSENLHEDNFLKTYKLTNKSNLFFVAYFNNSLTNYKHQLLPQYTY